MKKIVLGLVLVLAGCCSTPGESYIKADRSTYDFAKPKLEAWAKQKAEAGDKDWESIVKNKLISWDARISKWESKEQEGE